MKMKNKYFVQNIQLIFYNKEVVFEFDKFNFFLINIITSIFKAHKIYRQRTLYKF